MSVRYFPEILPDPIAGATLRQSWVQLLDNRVGNALGYAIILFLVPFFVARVAVVVGKC